MIRIFQHIPDNVRILSCVPQVLQSRDSIVFLFVLIYIILSPAECSVRIFCYVQVQPNNLIGLGFHCAQDPEARGTSCLASVFLRCFFFSVIVFMDDFGFCIFAYA